MRKIKPTNTTQDIQKLTQKLNNFFRGNIYLLAFAMVGMTGLNMCSNSSFKSEALATIKGYEVLLKENLGKVHFLSASGQHVVGNRYEVGYEDDRFKQYLKNIILDNLVQGLSELTNGFTVVFRNGAEIKKKNERFAYFEKTFVPKGSNLLGLYRNSLHRIVVEGRLPEYISLSSSKFIHYYVERKTKEQQNNPHLKGSLSVKVFLKSWIKELKVWDTREVTMNIPFEAVVDIEKYANIGNPFGISFIELEIPTILKPKASDVQRKLRKR